MSKLNRLLDSYYKARTIGENDQRSLATGVLGMVKAEHEIEAHIKGVEDKNVLMGFLHGAGQTHLMLTQYGVSATLPITKEQYEAIKQWDKDISKARKESK
jgi:hypothetical protein